VKQASLSFLFGGCLAAALCGGFLRFPAYRLKGKVFRQYFRNPRYHIINGI
jgi:hypothetical protein